MTLKTTLKTLISLVLFTGIFQEKTNAQWSSIASMGSGPTDECFSFSLHGKGYVSGGSGSANFYEYDTLTNTWANKGAGPGNKIRGAGFAFVANGKGYAGCGDTTGNDNPTADMWMYNDTTNTWTRKSNFPIGGRDALFCFAINDTAYIGGGFDSAGSEWNDFYKYNPFTDTWTALSPLPMGGIAFAATFVIGNKGYLATGVESAEVKSLWEYDPASNTWTEKADFPGAARQTAFGFSINDYGYVGGGMAGYDTVFTDVWQYNPATDMWTAVQNFPSRSPAWSCAFNVGNTAYTGTGTHFDTSTVAPLVSTDSFKRYRGTPNTTGIMEVNSGRQIELYPNPAGDFITIAGNITPRAIISVNDVSGREVERFTADSGPVYVGGLSKGFYVVRYIDNSGVYTARFIKE